jgi:hypothetical protein
MHLCEILNDMLEPEGGDLSVCYNGGGLLIRWQPVPDSSLIQYHLEPKVLENAVSIEDLAVCVANLLEQRYKELSQSFPVIEPHPLQPLKDLSGHIEKIKKQALQNGGFDPQDLQYAMGQPAGPIPLPSGGPIQIDGKELVAAVMKEVVRLAPGVTHQMMALDPSYVLVKDQGLVWFTFHAPYFMQYVNRRSGQFELGEQGLKVVKGMVRQVQGIPPEGCLPVDWELEVEPW